LKSSMKPIPANFFFKSLSLSLSLSSTSLFPCNFYTWLNSGVNVVIGVCKVIIISSLPLSLSLSIRKTINDFQHWIFIMLNIQSSQQCCLIKIIFSIQFHRSLISHTHHWLWEKQTAFLTPLPFITLGFSLSSRHNWK
jgi:hypothetical protein